MNAQEEEETELECISQPPTEHWEEIKNFEIDDELSLQEIETFFKEEFENETI